MTIQTTNGALIDPTAPTWLVIHGLNSSSTTNYILALTGAIFQAEQKATPAQQVLTLDWSSAADTGVTPQDAGMAEDAISSVGQWAANELERAGFSMDELNIVGHSYGSYVGEEIAMNSPLGINTIVALDPGQDENTIDDSGQTIVGHFYADREIHFYTDTKFSWAFYGEDIYGDATTAATADEAFLMEFPGKSVLDATVHDDVPSLFANMISSDDTVSIEFSLANLLAGDLGPWKPDQYLFGGTPSILSLGTFDAKIIADSSGVIPAKLKYYPDPAGSQVTIYASPS